ncbi:MAG TPA: tetratricopeptide repeat protein [Bryobacteraceae bacterium]|jgi:tetratricopeptide (TPR) repeat protein
MAVRTALLACVVGLLCAQTSANKKATAPTVSNAEAQRMLDHANSLWKQGLYKDANDQFRALVDAVPDNPDYRVRWGELYLERFQPSEATDLFNEALEIKPNHARALLGLARLAADEYDHKASELAEKAIESDPKLYEARELMARIALEDNNPEKSKEQADMALAINPDAVQAMAIRGTIELLGAESLDQTPESPWFQKILDKHPHDGAGYSTAAHFFVINRRYEEGIGFYRKAIAVQPDLWEAHSELGINLMRLGRDGEARKELELAWNNLYQNKPTSNTLKLMDSYKNFKFFENGNTILKLNDTETSSRHFKEAEILRPYFESELKRAISVYEKKYQFHLTAPVQVEVYPDHEDFAVRTMGMPGLGALGVTFGTIVAMDSPSGRPPGTFHWDSTMWHELSHVFVLSMTKHRVPRWFTEGLAVHEEIAASGASDWGDRLDPHVIAAIKGKKLLPVADLDRGFIHPTYPEQVVVSYYQAGKICDFISKKWGEPKLLELVHAFTGNTPTPEVIKQHLGLNAEEFDKEFMAYLDGETKKTVEGFDKWREGMKEADKLDSEGKKSEAKAKLLEVRDIYPDFVERGSAYELLAKIYVGEGDKTNAMAQLEQYSKIGGRDPETLKKLATLQEEAGKKKEAMATLTRLLWIDPVDQDLLTRLGGLEMANNDNRDAIREYRAALALHPLDQATSHYNLAQALRAAGENDQARDEVLASLEAAPGFRPAQKMLLELTAKTNN